MRYLRNRVAITAEEQHILGSSSVCVVGCGGLGGYIIEMLARIGVGNLTVIDKDYFDSTNLNRQILATDENIGSLKAEEAKDRVQKINSEVKVNAIATAVDETNAIDFLKGNDIVIDALDSIGTRFVLEKAASKLNIPLVHGAVEGWYGQVAVIMPDDFLLKRIYKNYLNGAKERATGNISFPPALVAAIEVGEAIKLLLKKDSILRNKLLRIDCLENEYTIIDI